MVTVQQIFDQAIHLMDEQNERNGATVTVDTQEYKSRTISILNTAIPRLYPYSSNYDRNAVGRPAAMILKNDDHANPDFAQNIMLDDDLCIGLLPFYLAAQLLSAENEDLAAWFITQYRECLSDYKRNIPAVFEQISSPYGAF